MNQPLNLRGQGLILGALLVALTIIPGGQLVAQEFSEKKEVAVLSLSYDDVPVRIEIPPELQEQLEITVIVDNPRTGERNLPRKGVSVKYKQQEIVVPTPEEVRSEFTRGFSNIDSQIRQAFVEIGRFDIIGETFSISEPDIDSFVKIFREYRENGVALPEEVQLGRQSFTAGDFQRLIDGYYLVVPAVSYYMAELTEDTEYNVEIEVAFAFIDMELGQTFERFTISLSGSGENLSRAISSAITTLPSRLSFRIRQIEEFQILTGITDIIGRQVLIEFGKNMGIEKGDEYAIVTVEQVGSYSSEEESGLIYITDVRENFSFGVPVYSKNTPVIGDQLREVPRFGTEVEVYGGVQNMDMENLLDLMPVFGFLVTGSRGFYPIRPLMKIELPFTFARGEYNTVDGSYVSTTLAVGGEYMLMWGRFRLAPYVLLGGIGGTYTDALAADEGEENDSTRISHLGVSAGARVGYHLTRDILLTLDPAFRAFVGLDAPSIIGPVLSFGVVIK